jgi:hypothetical protein
MRARFAAGALFAVVLSGYVAAACGGGEPPPAVAPPAPTESASAPPAASAAPVESAAPAASASASAAPAASGGPPGPGEWDKWSHDQKLEYMKTAVMPKMGGLFHDFDAKLFAEPKCGLCHGAGVKDGSFKMPNPDLPKLDVSPAGFKAMAAKHPKMVDFMEKQVEPTMAGLIGEPPYDPKTQQGFGCLGCHTMKATKKPAGAAPATP